MDAHIYLTPDGEILVSLRIAGVEVESAGPFEDETDAILMAERSVFDGGQVILTTGYRQYAPVGGREGESEIRGLRSYSSATLYGPLVARAA